MPEGVRQRRGVSLLLAGGSATTQHYHQHLHAAELSSLTSPAADPRPFPERRCGPNPAHTHALSPLGSQVLNTAAPITPNEHGALDERASEPQGAQEGGAQTPRVFDEAWGREAPAAPKPSRSVEAQPMPRYTGPIPSGLTIDAEGGGEGTRQAGESSCLSLRCLGLLLRKVIFREEHWDAHATPATTTHFWGTSFILQCIPQQTTASPDQQYTPRGQGES